ncbi:hypothetical protein NIES4101_36430 [Calothrix sp. NIES-4101]|nr:hypothetical protein NIES4101_36430 [Calothrix sp. NIES-4101]
MVSLKLICEVEDEEKLVMIQCLITILTISGILSLTLCVRFNTNHLSNRKYNCNFKSKILGGIGHEQ